MSAHSSPHTTSSESHSSFWPVANIVLAVIIGGFALFWGAVLLVNGSMLSAGMVPPEAPAQTTAAPAAEAPGQATTAAAAPAPATTGGAAAEITISVDPANPLAYDTKEFTVKAGQPVKLTFKNVHPVPQPHNVVIAAVGAKEKLFGLAMQMATDPEGMAKGYIPNAPEILFHTKLLQPNESETLEFTAPAAGDYPYMCTFPGHGAIMNGVMKVE